MVVHELKTLNPFFDDVFFNRKEFEVRKNDRNFQVGDRLKLIELPPFKQARQRFVLKDIKYILQGGQYGIDKDYVVLGLQELSYPVNVKRYLERSAKVVAKIKSENEKEKINNNQSSV